LFFLFFTILQISVAAVYRTVQCGLQWKASSSSPQQNAMLESHELVTHKNMSKFRDMECTEHFKEQL